LVTTLIRKPGGEQQAQILLLGDDRFRLVARVGRDDHFGEDLDDLARRLRVERPVRRDDAAEGAHRIASERLGIGLRQRPGRCHPAWIGVLDDGDGGTLGRIELGDQLEGGVGVVEIVVGKLLALHLARRGDAEALLARAIEGRPLLRVLAVAQRLGQRAGDCHALLRALAECAGEPGRDRRVILRCAGEGACGKRLAQGKRGRAAMRVHLG
jgi:hypothetical protein